MIENDNESAQPEKDDNAKHWYLWIFYFNPDDKRIFPPKRLKGLGWTINFANPNSVGVFLLMVIAFFFIARFLRK